MDVDEYRNELLSTIRQERARESDKGAGPAKYLKLTGELAAGAPELSSVTELSIDRSNVAQVVPHLLGIIRDNTLAPEVRLAAISKLDAAAFLPTAFAPFVADLLEALRALARDPDKVIRAAALERLALENDSYAQQLLCEDLQKKRPRLLPAAKAVQLLGFDDHGPGRELLRSLASNGRGKTREEAIRALASDTKAGKLLSDIMSNKSERPLLRQLSAASLKGAAPRTLAKATRVIVLDQTDNRNVQAAALAAVSQTIESAKAVGSKRFASQLRKIGKASRSRKLKDSISRLERTIRNIG